MTLDEINQSIEKKQTEMQELILQRDSILNEARYQCMHIGSTIEDSCYTCNVCELRFYYEPKDLIDTKKLKNFIEYYKFSGKLTVDEASVLYDAITVLDKVNS